MRYLVVTIEILGAAVACKGWLWPVEENLKCCWAAAAATGRLCLQATVAECYYTTCLHCRLLLTASCYCYY